MGGETARDVVTSRGRTLIPTRNPIGWAMGGATERASDMIGRFTQLRQTPSGTRGDGTEMREERPGDTRVRREETEMRPGRHL